jgi:hypothetical protein
MQLELSDAERDALARFLRSAIDADADSLSSARAAQGDFDETGPTASGAADSAAEDWNSSKAALGRRGSNIPPIQKADTNRKCVNPYKPAFLPFPDNPCKAAKNSDCFLRRRVINEPAGGLHAENFS